MSCPQVAAFYLTEGGAPGQPYLFFLPPFFLSVNIFEL